MLNVFIIALLMTLHQLAGAYLRYLPFAGALDPERRRVLWRRFLLWSLVGMTTTLLAFRAFGLDIVLYKQLLMFGWLPYLAFSLTVIRGRFAEHVFVVGMQGLWTMLLHTLSAIINWMFFGPSAQELLLSQIVLYVAWFLVLLPVERRLFGSLLPDPQLLDDNYFRWYAALIPGAVYFGIVMSVADAQYLRSPREQIARCLIISFFFAVYRSMNLATKQIRERRRQEKAARLMGRQFSTLREHNLLMQDAQRQMAELSASMRDNYARLYDMIEAGDPEGAAAHIEAQERRLDATAIRPYCHSPLVNAALSIYLGRAKALGIRVRQRINLPPRFRAAENDLAVLLSNLLENAVAASENQPREDREISCVVEHRGGQCVLEVENRCGYPVAVGADGLPRTGREGHGIGMVSVTSFAKKYGAYVDFSQEDGWARFSVYWEDAAAK